MTDSADVVIIGGGIVGSSIAWHLARAGCRNVVMLERESRQGLGSTGKSMGGVRAQFSTPVNVRMSLYSIPFFARFEAETGYPSGYRPHGYLFVATTGEHLCYLESNLRMQQSLGLTQACLIQPDEVRKLVPQLRHDDIVGGAYCPTDGFVDPHSVMTGFTESACASGLRLVRHAEVTAIDVDSKGVSGVRTAEGAWSTRTVVNAAGPWAESIAEMAGVNLPVEPLRRMLVPTEPFPDLPDPLPMTVDLETGFHFRREGTGLLLAWADPDQDPGFDDSVDPAFIEKILTHAVNRVPGFAKLEVNPRRAWAGLYEVSPDHHAILGPTPDLPGLFFANGFSGHGVMHSPATGRILADLILTGQTSVIDPSILNVTRFRDGRMVEESVLL